MADPSSYEGKGEYDFLVHGSTFSDDETLDRACEADVLLLEKNKLPFDMPMQAKKNLPWITKGQTTVQEAARLLDRLPGYYIRHILHEDLKSDPSPSTLQNLKDYLVADPTGENAMDQNDGLLFRPASRARGVPTLREFAKELKTLQTWVYAYLRASLHRYVCKQSKVLIDNWIREQSGSITGLTKKNYMNRDVRIKWTDFKTFILSNICLVTLGSSHFTMMYCHKRADKQTFHAWLSTANKLCQKVVDFGHGWENVVQPEAVAHLIDWLTTQEKKVLDQHLLKTNQLTNHISVDNIRNKLMTNGMTMDKFFTLFNAIPSTDLPINFSQRKERNALAKILIPNHKFMVLEKRLREQTAEMATLKSKLKVYEKANKHLGSSIVRTLKKMGNPSKPTRTRDATAAKDDPNTDQERPHGKAKRGHCQLCRDAGLGNRKHPKGQACDPDRRNAAVLKRRQLKSEKLEHKNSDDNRKYALRMYNGESCEICKKEDVNPKFATRHNKDICFRRPGGELEQSGFKGKSKKQRTDEVIRLMKDKMNASEAKRKTKNRSDVGSSKVSRGVPIPRAWTDPFYSRLSPRQPVIPKDVEHLWSTKNRYFTHRYKLNVIAVKQPMTEREVDSLLHKDIRNDPRQRAQIWYTYEKRALSS